MKSMMKCYEWYKFGDTNLVVEANDSFMHDELAKDDGVQLKSFS